MTVDRREVERIAALSRIPLEPAEADRLAGEMNRILEHADRLREAAGEGGRGPEGPAGGGVREGAGESGLRDPAAGAPDPLARPIDTFAPRTEDGFFVVPPPQGVTAEEEA
jgi:aspartyl-tRNA(Asn)/glutamyl-tRNA(Gln) amidotransferase subunit C